MHTMNFYNNCTILIQSRLIPPIYYKLKIFNHGFMYYWNINTSIYYYNCT